MGGIEEIVFYGFEEVGEWELDKETKANIRFKFKNDEYENRYKNKRVIYCFVVESEVKYIGICESKNTGLLKRMQRYERLQGGGTNEHIAKLIFELIKSCGKHVKVYALDPSEKCSYKNVEIDMVRGLEYPLIEKFNPEWNRKKS